ncbi:MAG: c-type cytochrome [Verrucomicrobiae bacterium]|nr:c-type cytochrome [Verrucomicrobiae bacterium]
MKRTLSQAFCRFSPHTGFRLTVGSLVLLLAVPFVQAGHSLDPKELRARALDFLAPIPDRMPGAEDDTPARIELGRKLYFETALSENRTQSCNTCHRVDEFRGGVDNEATSPGAFGKRGGRNSPTVLNAGFQFVQFWDGRAEDLVEQAKGPVLNPIEMAMPSEAVVIERLQSKPHYVEAFAQAFPGVESSLSYGNVARAIAAFERTLVTRDRFDDFLNGDDQALTAVERRGLDDFLTLGCTTCHYGPVLGGQSFMKVGLIHSFPTDDKGRFDVTQEEDDEYRFKVPMLRNIELTHPYFHKGQIATLEESVRKMGWHQLGLELSEEQVGSLVAFLRTLTDKERRAGAQAAAASR